MAKLTDKPKIELELTLTLSEVEARALYDLTGYGTDEFLKVFYEHLGRAYLGKNEDGLRSLFNSLRDILPTYISKVDLARAIFER